MTLEKTTMSTITVNDLDLGKALDRQAMAKLSGGYTFTGSSTSNGSWSFVSQSTQNGGFKQIGFVKYKVDRLHKRYQRTQTRTDTYEQLTVVIG
jgi:hypothetical protein